LCLSELLIASSSQRPHPYWVKICWPLTLLNLMRHFQSALLEHLLPTPITTHNCTVFLVDLPSLLYVVLLYYNYTLRGQVILSPLEKGDDVVGREMGENPLYPYTIVAVLKGKCFQATAVEVTISVVLFVLNSFCNKFIAFLHHVNLPLSTCTSLNLICKRCSPTLPIPAPQSSAVSGLKFFSLATKSSMN
jgi:hypothetical protein